LKYDASTAGGGGTGLLSTTVSNPGSGSVYAYNTFQALAAKAGVTVPMLLKLLGLMPPGGELEGDGFWLRNFGERLPFRGGIWRNGAGAGVFALDFYYPRAYSNADVGFRAAFVNL